MTYEPNSMVVPTLAREPKLMVVPSLAFVPPSLPILVSSSNDDIEDENPPSLAHISPNESIECEPIPTPQLIKWVRSTREVVGDLVGVPIDH